MAVAKDTPHDKLSALLNCNTRLSETQLNLLNKIRVTGGNHTPWSLSIIYSFRNISTTVSISSGSG